MGKHYIRFDEIEDVLTSVDLIALTVPLARTKPSYWKWIIIGAQNGFQGAMVCLLAGTSGIDVLDKRSAKRVAAWHDDMTGPYPTERLADFEELLDRVRNRPIGRSLTLTESELEDIKRLHGMLRNNFAHFRPKGWSIERAGLPRIVSVALDGIEKIMFGDELSYKLSGNRRRRLRKGLDVARKAMP
jgi:hypothetical protein